MRRLEQVIAYVDGFNLYFGLRQKHWHRYYWLDVQRLAQNLIRPGQHLVTTKYFTSRVSRPATKRKRQSDYLEALDTLPGLQIFYGKYQVDPRECGRCGQMDYVPHEKMTDVNIAVELLTDAFQNRFDVALLISADSDLVAPVVSTRTLFPTKRVIIAFPPERSSKELKKVANANFQIGRRTIAASLLPFQITKPSGIILECPPGWR